MKIGIIGTRGIPNAHGGFEQFAEYLSEGLVNRGHSVIVYNSHNHPYKNNSWRGVDIIHQYDPEEKIGTIGQFIYDLNCILDSRNRNFDIIIQLGYNSNSVWHRFLPKDSLIVTNMDGLEWKRAKYSKIVQQFLKYAESLAAKSSDYLIADSKGIQRYLRKRYGKDATYIPYGAYPFDKPKENVITNLDLSPYGYDMLIARLEPENNIEMILEGFSESEVDRDFVVVGNYFTEYGQYIREKYTDERIRYMGKIYDIDILNNLRYFSNLYFHGHSVGGTNPSLLEAMASESLICAHNNMFNKAILGDDAYFFNNSHVVAEMVNTLRKEEDREKVIHNTQKIYELYSWPHIISQCETFLLDIMGEEKVNKKIQRVYIPRRTEAASVA